MELRHLRYFVAVADALNFTKAAEQLHLAQPSLTRQIHNLEGELGVRLFNREKNQVTLTAEGRAFLSDAKRLLAQAEESVNSVQRLSRGHTGELNIAYLSNFNFELLPETLGAFRIACPHVSLNLFDMSPAEQLRALEARKIDLGFIGLRPPRTPKDLQWECISHHEIVVVLPAHHPMAKKQKIHVTELKQEFFIGMSEISHPGFRDWLIAACRPGGFVPRIIQDAELESALMQVIAQGLGVTLARSEIRKLPHPGVVFRTLMPTIKTDHWIAWNQNNGSPTLLHYVNIVKKTSGKG
ncbi:MAG TPA: LysR substrate-binding domain-containing protein [Verrucomicrobiae bacterium]|nr:LysR substrate-binding domain-containing protein [Verrucomicrobiae bacterium]